MPRARVFACCPASPRWQGGRGYPAPPSRLRHPASARPLPAWPLAGRLRAVRGARRGWVGWPWRCRFVGVCRGCCFFLRGASWGVAAVGRRAVAAGGRVGVVRGRAPLAVAPVGAVVLWRGGGGGVFLACRRVGFRGVLVGLVRVPGGGAAVRRSRRSALWRVGAGRPGAVRGGRAGGVASGGGVGGGRLSLAGRAVFPGRLAVRLRPPDGNRRPLEQPNPCPPWRVAPLPAARTVFSPNRQNRHNPRDFSSNHVNPDAHCFQE